MKVLSLLQTRNSANLSSRFFDQKFRLKWSPCFLSFNEFSNPNLIQKTWKFTFCVRFFSFLFILNLSLCYVLPTSRQNRNECLYLFIIGLNVVFLLYSTIAQIILTCLTIFTVKAGNTPRFYSLVFFISTLSIQLYLPTLNVQLRFTQFPP